MGDQADNIFLSFQLCQEDQKKYNVHCSFEKVPRSLREIKECHLRADEILPKGYNEKANL